MPNVEDYVRQAERNESAAEYLARGGFYEWATTALFYAALSLIQAYLQERQVEATSHRQRRLRILEDPGLRTVSTLYNSLKISSERGRYECLSSNEQEYEETRSGPYSAVVERVRLLRGTLK
jgi:hypothetical protein